VINICLQEIPAMTTHVADPYAILGVATEASDDDLDHAFRVLIRQLHSDTRTAAESTGSDDGADQRLQEILNAYATLRDPIRRAAYDRARARPVTAAKTTAAGPAAPATRAPDTLQRPGPTRVGPALRVGPVHWEPPQAIADSPAQTACGVPGHTR
jgi:curved DNA-binding protein CbpA